MHPIIHHQEFTVLLDAAVPNGPKEPKSLLKMAPTHCQNIAKALLKHSLVTETSVKSITPKLLNGLILVVQFNTDVTVSIDSVDSIRSQCASTATLKPKPVN